MNIYFDPIESEYVKNFFYEFFNDNGVFFEIIYSSEYIGFYGIKTITEKVCEISVYFTYTGRWKITKEIVFKCLKFPFSLGFTKVIIRTELKKMTRFLSKLKKYGVNYLFKHNEIDWFEVLP
jgi:hypothetical protein